MEKKDIEILQTTILLLDDCKMDILRSGLLKHLKKAEKIVNIIKE